MKNNSDFYIEVGNFESSHTDIMEKLPNCSVHLVDIIMKNIIPIARGSILFSGQIEKSILSVL